MPNPIEPLSARVVIVTGASQGIGAALALRFAEEGAKVICSDVKAGGAEATAARIVATHPESDAIGVVTDVTDPASCDQLVATAVERHGRLDVLAVATAIMPEETPLEQLDPAEWDRIMTFNAKGPFLLSRSAIPALTTPGGTIVYVYSGTAQKGVPGRAVYTASKGALGAMIKSLALELAPRHITVNGVAPLHLEAEINDADLVYEATKASITVEEARAQRDKDIPLGRSATALEVADAMLYLSSPEARYITGAVLDINGGAVLR
jgi:NAD(P)-dependent dehydrogenase (short-subunit alcohol dehydrogenase family)